MDKKDASSLIGNLYNQGLSFNVLHDKPIDNLLKAYRDMFDFLQVSQIPKANFYRARIIDLTKDVDTGKGISKVGNCLIGGFNAKNSGLPPAELCKAGRLNKAGEAVFYMADTPLTALREMKPQSDTYISLATFSTNKQYRVFDFTAYSKKDLNKVFNEEIVAKFNVTHNLDIRTLFVGVQTYLTLPNYKENHYAVSLVMADVLKTMPIDGIKYLSYFTNENNFAIWKYYESDCPYIESEIYYVNDTKEIIRIKDGTKIEE